MAGMVKKSNNDYYGVIVTADGGRVSYIVANSCEYVMHCTKS